MRGLGPGTRRVLQTIAASRMPSTYDQVAALLVGEGKLYANEGVLDEALAELENRGLFELDRRANRYDVHPLVHGVIWSLADQDVKKDIYHKLHAHFDSLPAVKADQVNGLEELTGSVELYNALINLRMYDKAFAVFRERLSDVTHYVFSASGYLGPNSWRCSSQTGSEGSPKLAEQTNQCYAMNALALAYHLAGARPRPSRSTAGPSTAIRRRRSKAVSVLSSATSPTLLAHRRSPRGGGLCPPGLRAWPRRRRRVSDERESSIPRPDPARAWQSILYAAKSGTFPNVWNLWVRSVSISPLWTVGRPSRH